MNIFNLFKSKEEIYYLTFRKAIKKNNSEKKNKNTVSNLKVNVLSVQYTIDKFIERHKEVEKEIDNSIINGDTKGFKKQSEEREDLKLKLTVLFRLKIELEKEYTNGVSLKIKELIDNGIRTDIFNYEEIKGLVSTQVPLDFKECEIFFGRLERAFSKSGRRIWDEEIKTI